MKASTAQWKGHAEPETTLLRAFQARRLHHGWLLAGPEGIGKRSFALAAAAHLLTRSPDYRADHVAFERGRVGLRQSLAGAGVRTTERCALARVQVRDGTLHRCAPRLGLILREQRAHLTGRGDHAQAGFD